MTFSGLAQYKFSINDPFKEKLYILVNKQKSWMRKQIPLSCILMKQLVSLALSGRTANLDLSRGKKKKKKKESIYQHF